MKNMIREINMKNLIREINMKNLIEVINMTYMRVPIVVEVIKKLNLHIML